LPIHDIAQDARHPDRVVGMHFFSPAERMPLLEVVRPQAASKVAVATAVNLGVRMGKTVIVVDDAPGFYTSRVLGVMMNEAALLLAEGARMVGVDRALVRFGFPVGPFVLFDEVGLEVAQHAGETVARAFGDRIPMATVVPALVKAGHTGKRGGADVGQVYVAFPGRLGEPLRQLKGFHRSFLQPGQSQRVTVKLWSRAFSWWDTTKPAWVESPGCYGIRVGDSSRSLPLRGRVAIGRARCRS